MSSDNLSFGRGLATVAILLFAGVQPEIAAANIPQRAGPFGPSEQSTAPYFALTIAGSEMKWRVTLAEGIGERDWARQRGCGSKFSPLTQPAMPR